MNANFFASFDAIFFEKRMQYDCHPCNKSLFLNKIPDFFNLSCWSSTVVNICCDVRTANNIFEAQKMIFGETVSLRIKKPKLSIVKISMWFWIRTNKKLITNFAIVKTVSRRIKEP